MAEVHHLQHEKEQLLVCIRREERRKRDALRDLKRIADEKDEISKKYEVCQNELNELRITYRKYLGDILEDQSSSSTTKATTPNPTVPNTTNDQHDNRTTARSGISSIENSEMVWQAVVDSYLQTEKKLLEEVESGNDNIRQMSVALRKLYDYYRSALDIIEDNCPQAIPTDILTSEAVLLQPSQSSSGTSGENSKGNTLSLLSESQVDHQIHSLRVKLQETEANLLAEQERFAAVIAKYRYLFIYNNFYSYFFR